jgi:2-C-methyl-D-erythritol 4-phosphate cytidylyltransferase
MTVGGVIVAAGRGQRFGGAKHTVVLGGVPLWQRARDSLRAGGVEPVVVVGDVPGGVPGGRRRRDSVLAGIRALPDDTVFVLVHDAARPLASAALVERVVARIVRGDVDGVVPAVPVPDTVKRVAGDRVIETLDRSDLVSVQTPQAFRIERLRAAHAADPSDATDDAALIERFGGSVALVAGEAANLKITFPSDLRIAEALL